jgi:hypothetical protein
MLNAARLSSRSRLYAGALTVLVVAGLTFLAIRGPSSGAVTSAEPALGKRDAQFWQQLVQNFRSGKSMGINSMADHELLMLPGGLVLALHFDNMNLAKAKNLNWIAVAVPGVFTRADQRRVNRLYGPGFTHFHDFEADVHAGKPGAKGVWFVHVGARNFTSPFGKVRAGKVDLNFMPTKPPR